MKLKRLYDGQKHTNNRFLKLTSILLVANSTPIVDFDSKLNSFLVKRESRLDFPTPESPISTTETTQPLIYLSQPFINISTWDFIFFYTFQLYWVILCMIYGHFWFLFVVSMHYLISMSRWVSQNEKYLRSIVAVSISWWTTNAKFNTLNHCRRCLNRCLSYNKSVDMYYDSKQAKKLKRRIFFYVI